MPDPLSADTVTRLRSDPTAALAALLILAGAFPELLAWVQRTLSPLNVGGTSGAESCGHKKKSPAAEHFPMVSALNGTPKSSAKRKAAKGNGGHGDYNARRRAQRDADDERLAEAMGQAPGASIGALARGLGKSRSAIQAALHRLRDRGLAESDGEQWRLSAPLPPPAKWIEPLSANRSARHAADGRVRDELSSMAASTQ